MDEVKLKDPTEFANQFVRLCLQEGFQSLTKRDLELLFFLLLERDGAVSRTQSNYEIGRKLRLTVNRIKNLRRDAYARWRTLLNETPSQTMKRILSTILTAENIKRGAVYASEKTKEEGFLAIRIEHPDDLAEFEQGIIDSGGIPVYERNREVISVRFDVLLSLAEKYNLQESNLEKARRQLDRLAPTFKEVEELLKKNLGDLKWADIRAVVNNIGAKAVAGIVDVKVTDLLKLALPFLK